MLYYPGAHCVILNFITMSKKMFGFFENGSYMEMTNPLLAKDDKCFFDDGKFYMYNGSSNNYPMYGVELDRKTFQPKGTRTPMYLLESWRYGWQPRTRTAPTR